MPASLAACVPELIATADVAWASAGGVVGAVAGHGDEASARLIFANELQFVLGRRLREIVVDAGFGRDRSSGEGIVTRDHHGLDPPFAGARLKRSLIPPFHDVLELDDAEDLRRLPQRRAACRLSVRNGLDNLCLTAAG